MDSIFDQSKLPLFNPKDKINGYGIGMPFNHYGKVFLFVGTLNIESKEVPALAVSDWSKGQFIASVNKDPSLTDAFIRVDDRYINGTSHSHPPAYATYDTQAIINILQLVREERLGNHMEFPPALDSLEKEISNSLTITQ